MTHIPLALRESGFEITLEICKRLAWGIGYTVTDLGYDLLRYENGTFCGYCANPEALYDTLLELVRKADPLLDKQIIVTDPDLLDHLDYDDDAIRGTVLAPSPAWIHHYMVSMRNGDFRYLSRDHFQIEE